MNDIRNSIKHIRKLTYFSHSLTGIAITLVTATETDDCEVDMKAVAIDNCNVGPITVSAVADNKVEGQGIEVFLLSIREDAAYIIDKPSIATVYIKGKSISQLAVVLPVDIEYILCIRKIGPSEILL